jgi:SAM-dependent methyltransferase
VAENKLSLLGAFTNWWRSQREEAKFPVALSQVAIIAWDFLRDSFPDRRHQRYGDVDYDWEKRVDTTSATVKWRTRLLGLLNSPYQPIPPEQFHEMMATLPNDFRRFTFIDIGSGKGRALLLAAEHNFRRIIGVELLPELNEIAKENARNLKSHGVDTEIEMLCCNATEFVFPTEPTVLFLFNPLPPAGLAKLMKNIEESLRSYPRELYLLYANPLLEEVVAGCPYLTRSHQTPTYSLFFGSRVD